ncbi:hypothetical protein H2201_006682 [Coniosporium apollinis]|uniref:RNA helicase n=1 Tax=Coniosporium apollinis TaxID=61459 RepID=A0ABQ9NNE9_9PEZI|nr:hypothetical protein H2201_006682 [Coniosporium apollinis]
MSDNWDLNPKDDAPEDGSTTPPSDDEHTNNAANADKGANDDGADANGADSNGADDKDANNAGDANGAGDDGAGEKIDAREKARLHGFVERTPYDYSVYASGRKDDDGADREEPAWLANAAIYEWNDDYGDVGPAIPQLEIELFGSDYRMQAGTKFDAFKYEVTVEAPEPVHPIREFADAGLHPVMLENIKLCGYRFPTPVQMYCIPAILAGTDVVAIAQTGSGKTGAYFIPILSRLMGKAKKLAAPRPNPRTYDPATDRVRAEPLVLVICPARELAVQIFDEARRLCYRSLLRPAVVYGGVPLRLQLEELGRGCDVLIATPGRLKALMDKPGVLSLNRVKFTIIDEADEMLQEDWEDDMKRILAGGDVNTDDDHTYMMFSATFPKEARQLAKRYMMDDHVRIRVGRTGSTHTNITQKVVYVDDSAKRQALYDLLFSLPPARTLIFVNSRRMADLLDDYLFNLELPSTSIHSDRTQAEREDAIRAFRTGQMPIMVATGVTARGLDIKNVLHVINYDLPSAAHGGIDEYVHRIGRTARIGNEGLATSFYNDRNEDIADALVKILVETKQDVPDFLADRIPEGDLEFDDESDKDSVSSEDTDKKTAMPGDTATDAAGEAAEEPKWDGGNDAPADDDGW